MTDCRCYMCTKRNMMVRHLTALAKSAPTLASETYILGQAQEVETAPYMRCLVQIDDPIFVAEEMGFQVGMEDCS